MKYCTHIFLILLILSAYTHAQQHLPTFFYQRSIACDAVRNLVGWTNYINKNIQDKSVYGALSITPEWNQTFSSNRITSTLFGNALTESSSLKISGSQVNDRMPQDLLADYFYLPTDFESFVNFQPHINNFIIDLGFYLGLDAWAKGLYFVLHAPFCHTRWNLDISENIINPGANDYAPGYFTPSAISRTNLLKDFTSFANGSAIKNIDTIAFQELKYAQMSSQRLIKSRVAEIRTTVGWNFFAEDDFHVGFNGQVAFPTGLRPKGDFLFEPIVGNSHFWELGLGMSGHYTFWRNIELSKQWQFYVDINLNHLFTTRQARTFDLISAGPLSRYMLAMEMTSPAVGLAGEGNQTISAQFNNEYLPVSNITTLNVNVDVTLQSDIVFMFNYTNNNISIDFGYNYWSRSKENITLPAIESFTENTFSLKGDSQIFGFKVNTPDAVALSATQSRATIHAGKNMPPEGSSQESVILAAQHNPGIDFPVKAITSPAPGRPVQISANNSKPTDQINTSKPPVFLTYNDIDVANAGSYGLSSKLFAHISYTAQSHNKWQPYIGTGGSVEWSHLPKHNTKNNNHSSASSASQWALWIKTGATF